MKLFIVAAFLVLQVVRIEAADLACNQITNMDECAKRCNDCQRLACCCGDDCQYLADKKSVIYNKCIAKGNTNFESWGCPTEAQCSSPQYPVGGLQRTISPGVCTTAVPTEPAKPPGGGSVTANGQIMKFGSTFPMIGTQKVNGETWHHNVYMGTSMKFNDGAYWAYTDSFYVPTITYYNPDGSEKEDPAVTTPPTPIPDYTGQACFGYLKPCPSGYYCKVAAGYHPEQAGKCAKQNTNNWGGAGSWGSNNIGGPLTQQGNGGAFPNSWFSTAGESCAPPSVCGYQAIGGSCWCDSSCAKTNDCCIDAKDHCPIASTTGVASTECTQASRKGDCTGKCGPGVVIHSEGKCYCDGTCLAYNDCCCNFLTVCKQ